MSIKSGQAHLLSVSEGTVRYHLRRRAAEATDGRAKQVPRAASVAEAIAAYLERHPKQVNLAALHEWLESEHGYDGRVRSVQRYVQKEYPRPAVRARRRVETPAGAQAQADWAEWPRVWIGGQAVYAYQFHLKLSHSRYAARIWSPRKDQLSWHQVHNEAFRRLEGVPAVVRVDNERTAVGRGAGTWGEINPSYRGYARAVRFHVDACAPRSPQAKGKVEREIRTARGQDEVLDRSWSSWEELQSWTDARGHAESSRRICPATGTTVREAWEAEKRFLSPLPYLPEPFDLVLTRAVDHDCTVAFEGRRYSVPFAWFGQRVEVRGFARVVQIYAEGGIVAEHARQGRERIVIDPKHYEGEPTARVLPPLPLGRMGRRLQEIAELAPERRPLDLYAALAEVAR
ncbi:MAG: IS21 family transposase [Candidatus Eisenbacteria bacterium]